MALSDLGATAGLVTSGAAVAGQLSNIGSATGLSSVTNSESGGIMSTLAKIAGLTGGVKLPLPNILSNYASYNYILTLSVLTIDELNNPDSTYKVSAPKTIICKTGGIEPNNRIQTSFGKFDFFMDNLQMESLIGMNDPKMTNLSTVSFDVVEPYSMGVFGLAVQQAAIMAGHDNWRDAPYLITINFRGNKEDGSIANIPSVTRHIPVRLTTMFIRANEMGSTYNISGYATGGQASTTQYANLKTNVSIKGKTVQELLQTGEQSLQAVVNKKLREYVTKKEVAVADEVIILFPKDISSSSSSGSKSGEASNGGSATVDTSQKASAQSGVYKKLGVTESTVNKTSIQKTEDCNELGKTSMGYDLSKLGDRTSAKESTTWDSKTGIWKQGNVTFDSKEGSLRFAQDIDIPTVIHQVMLLSEWPGYALDDKNLKDGFRPWWRIDTQVYYVESKENVKLTGQHPRIIVYRVVPYDTHSSKITVSGDKKAKGFDKIEKTVVKEYQYLYTGKNSEVLKFDIDFSVNFANVLAADDYENNQDVKTKDQRGVQTEKPEEISPTAQGSNVSKDVGTTTSQSKRSSTQSFWDRLGGGGLEDAKNRAGKLWHQAITNPNDMIVLNMDIVGDPFWIVNSGLGNYTSKPIDGIKDLNTDGTVNWQNGEVDIRVLFRSPIDINQATGLYNFAPIREGAKDAPVKMWSGLYYVNRVTNIFKGGRFTQTLKGARRYGQEFKAEATDSGSLSTSVPAVVPGLQQFDDGSSIQTFDDGSTITTDSSGKRTTTNATQ